MGSSISTRSSSIRYRPTDETTTTSLTTRRGSFSVAIPYSEATWGISWWNLSLWKKRLFKKRTTIKCQQSTTRRTTPPKSKICKAVDRPSLEDCETNKMLRWYKLYRSNRSFIGIANEIAKQSTAYWY